MPDAVQPLLPRAPHGGPGARSFSGHDFSVNGNPYGPNPALVRAARSADVSAYPDPASTEVREALARMHGVRPDEVVPATGASELLHRAARAFLREGDVAVSVGPPFGEFVRSAALARARVLTTDVDGALTALGRGARLVYTSRPNNPLGTVLPPGDLAALAGACGERGALLVLDEAYAPFLPGLETVTDGSVLRLQSPGKVHGVVGLRPAYALAEPRVAAALDNLAPAWPLSAPTAAVLAALPHAQDFVRGTLPRWQADAHALAARLARIVEVNHTGLPFFTVEVGDGGRVARDLLALGVRVRDCASYGFASRIRVSAARSGANLALVRAMKEVYLG